MYHFAVKSVSVYLTYLVSCNLLQSYSSAVFDLVYVFKSFKGSYKRFETTVFLCFIFYPFIFLQSFVLSCKIIEKL